MNEPEFMRVLAIGMLVLAAAVFLTLFFVTAPYGRHIRGGWGPATDNIKGWLLMEAPAPLVLALCFVLGSNPRTVTILVLLVLWELHYVHRAFIYPFSLRGRDKQIPLVIVGSGIVFNTVNAYLNGRYIFTYADSYTNAWLADPRFIVGVVLFIAGYIVNRRADGILRRLRKPGESGYLIINTGLYRWISCPNYLGEIIIWIGWAVATWSLPGLVFALWSAANLVPRAKAHHTWYRRNFPEYPPNRKALLPGLW